MQSCVGNHIIHDKYKDLVSAIERAGYWQGAIEIHPAFVSHTGSTLSATWQSLKRLTYFSAGRPLKGGRRLRKEMYEKSMFTQYNG
eukprot:scaffold24683_cov16-Prasinocladus_malaysianus.AAC.1